MKTKRKLSTRLVLFATAGAFFYSTAPAILADDAASGRQADQQSQSQDVQSSSPSSSQSDQRSLQSGQSEFRSDSELKSNAEISEPAGAERKTSGSYQSGSQTRGQTSIQGQAQGQASFGTLQKSSDILGMEVRNSQGEKLGEIKDAVIDTQSGRLPFLILSPSFMSGKLVAVPPSAFTTGTEEKTVVLDFDKERLQSAPSFDRAHWPNWSDQKWSTEVYHFYNAQPYWQSSSIQGGSFHGSTTLDEPSGASVAVQEPAGASTTISTYEYGSVQTGSAKELDAEGNRKLHLYQRGKQAAEFTDRQLKEKGPPLVIIPSPEFSSSYSTASEYRSGTSSGVYVEPSAAERSTTYSGTEYRGTTTTPSTGYSSTAASAGAGHFYRVSELMGMNIKNAEGQTVGEIKDLAIDLHSGRVAYAALGAGGFLGIGEKWVAVPVTLLNVSSDQKTLALNVDKETLRNAPTFDRANWSEMSNQDFVAKVYSHYGQQPYWQASGQVTEPAGTQRQQFEHNEQFQQNDQKDQFEHKDQFKQDQNQDQNLDQKDQRKEDQSSKSGAELNEPSGAQKSSDLKSSDTQSDAYKSDQSLKSDQNLQESSGAQKNDLEQKKESPEKSSSEISEPSGAEKSQDQKSQDQEQSSPDQSSLKSPESSSAQAQSSAPSAGFQSSAGQSSQINEQAGAQAGQSAQSSSSDLQSSQSQSGQSQPDQSSQVNEQAGAQSGQSAQSSSTDLQSSQSSQGAAGAQNQAGQSGLQGQASSSGQSSVSGAINEPSGAQSSRSSSSQSSQGGLQSSQSSSSADLQSGKSQSSSGAQVGEAAGAASSKDQSDLVNRVKMSIQSDSSISGAQNIQVTSENGKIVLKGTVGSEAEKQRIEEKIRGMIVDNQLQVQGGLNSDQSKPEQK